MFRKLTYSIVFSCLTATFLFSQASSAQQRSDNQKPASTAASSAKVSDDVNLIEGKVVYVYDGDTISVQTSDKLIYFIRLQGIDAPENKQNYGKKSRKRLADLVEGKDVKVVMHKKDLYDRYVSSVYFNGQDVSLMQVQSGMAWHYKQYSNEQTPEARKRYAQAEQRAREEKLGLWEDSNPTPPWENKNGKTKDGNSSEKIADAPAGSGATEPKNKAAAANAQTNTTPAPAKTPSSASNGETTATPTQTETKDAKSNDASGKKYIRGPRGGCYYINKNGGKTYVNRNLCQE